MEDVTGEGPLILGTEPLPATMQGIFWLTKQGKSSALCSMGGPPRDPTLLLSAALLSSSHRVVAVAGPSNDGAGVSTGVLSKNPYRVRVVGDRTRADRSEGRHAALRLLSVTRPY